jgi:hypothetical protein
MPPVHKRLHIHLDTTLHRIEARSFWGLAARVNLILLVHNLIRSRVLLRMAGVELGSVAYFVG